jgi:hypothetical protein
MAESWEKPAFTEIVMNAEIGSYQEDAGGRGNPPVIEPAAAAAVRDAMPDATPVANDEALRST